MVTTVNSKTLREERGQLVKQMQDMVKDANEREVPGLTGEERETFEKLDAAQDALTTRAKDIEKIETLDVGGQALPAISLGDMAAPERQDDRQRSDAYEAESRAFTDYLKGRGGVPAEHQSSEDRGWRMQLRQQHQGLEHRATTAQTVTTPGGGNTIPNAMMAALEEALKAHGGVRDVATVIRTDSGATLPVPTVNDSTEVATILAINTEADVKSMSFGQKTFSAYKYTSGVVLIPKELMEDSAVDLPSFIGGALGTRVARGTNAHFTTGQATDTQPQGIVNDTVAGVTAATRNTVTYGELLSLQHAVDPAYRADPSCGWMFSDNTLQKVKQLVDSQGRPLWMPGLTVGEPDTLLGYGFTINQDMASMGTATGAAKKAILFGAMNRYWIRDVRDITLLRLDERYATLAQTAFLTFSRHDGGMVIAATGNRPVSHLITST